MKKQSQNKPIETAVNLGTKRTCPKCGVKFYDFQKTEMECPKCHKHINLLTLAAARPFNVESKKAKAQPKVKVEKGEDGDEVVLADADNFESVDDLADGDDVVEKIDLDDDGDENDY